MNRITCFAVLVIASLPAMPAMAEKNANLQPKLGTLGSPSISLAFDEGLPDSVVAVKGQWQVVDGVLVGKELEADKHAAVLNCQKPNRDSAVRFSFKFDGTTNGMHFSLNHAQGHLFRVIVTPTGLTVNLDKDKKDPASKAVAIATAKGTFDQGEWYTMLVEIRGNEVAVQTDNGLSVSASQASLDTDKPNYRFVMRGDSLTIDDLQIWELN